MHAAARKAKNANSCSSPWYKTTNAGTCSALCVQTPAMVCRYITQPLMLADTNRYMQTQTDTWHDQPKSMLLCAKSEADVYTCRHRHTQSPQWMARCRDTNTRQPMQIHAELSTQASTCWALDTSWNLHLHTRLSNRENARKYMRSFMNAETCRFNTQLLMLAHTWWYYFQPQPNQHMEINAKLLIHIETCVQHSELDTGQHLFLYIIMKILLQRRKLQKDARLSTRANTRKHTLSSQHAQT
jgi:hypothetical protein